MASLSVRTIRQKLNIADVNIPDMFTFEAWRGSAIIFQVGIFNGYDVIDLDTVTSINMRVKNSQIGSTTLMDKTITSFDLDLTAEEWLAGTEQHCLFEYSNAEANLTMTTPKMQLWVVFTAILNSGASITLGGGTFFLHEDNNAASDPPEENLGTAITIEEADARYALAGGGISDGDKGDVTVSASGTVWTIDSGVVNNAKLATVATSTIKGRTTAGTGAVEDLTPAQGRTVLGLGTASTTASTDYATAAQGTDERVPTSAGLTSKFSTNKATIVDADKIAIFDSAASDAPKHSLFSLIKSTLKTYFDGFYVDLTGNQTIAGNKTFSGTTEAAGINLTADSTLTGTLTSNTLDGVTGVPTFQLGETTTASTYASINGYQIYDTSSFPTIRTGGIYSTTLTGNRTWTFKDESGTVAFTSDITVTATGTETLTNKRITPRVTTITSSATPTVNSDDCDMVTITALAAAITSMTTNLTGTPSNGDMLLFRIKDNGTARAITWGASFVQLGSALPTTTVLSKTLHALFIWDSVVSKWACISTSQEF